MEAAFGNLADEGKVEFSMIHVIATIEIAPGRRDDFLSAFQELVPDVRAETGCVEYGPAVDLATTIGDPPAEPRENVVTVIEKWLSVEALKQHLEAPHMQRYRRTVKDIVKAVAIRVLEPA
ncbi:MAG TPA: putative quinol monooxygenase [Lacipirellulaceae bacterium]